MITQNMIDAQIKEIEEALVTEKEFAEMINISQNRIHYSATKLRIKPYRIYCDNKLQVAYNKEQARKIIDFIGSHVVRKNVLTADELMR